MPKKKEVLQEVSEEILEESTANAEIPSAIHAKDEVFVYEGSVFVRKYTKAEHGADFMKLARGFISKNLNRELRDR